MTTAPGSPPRIIHMPLEDLIDPELKFDCPESAGDNPTAYVLKSDVDKMAEALNTAANMAPVHDAHVLQAKQECAKALAAYREAKG